MDKLNELKGQLVVSCQALPDEPLHSSFVMGKMALAAKQGGAKGIRANSVEDIKEIQKVVDLPIIGIIKKNYGDCEVYITPTMDEVDALVETGCEIIAMQATDNIRPNGQNTKEFFEKVKAKYPNQKFMADCSTLQEAILADEIGFDFIGTTMVGYTKQSQGLKIETDDFKLMKDIIAKVKHPVIAEGNIDTPEKAKRVKEIGCFTTVVGSIITRPQVITKRFVDKIKEI